jgi:glycosyltransferase involved in cell wall biosynthesis
MISVIIPAYNAAQTLPACLKALSAQTMPADQFEIIVVDDGSTDNTAGIARQAGVRVVSQPNAGAAAARNLGAHFARGDLLLFTDADCLPTPDWVAQMSAPFAADPTLAGAKGVYRTRQPELTARFVQMEYQDKYDRMLGTERIDFVDTYSAAYRRDLFLQMGGFDTTFPGASVEDQEFSFRLAGAGYRLIFIPEAKVWHTHDRTLAEYARRKFFIGYWKSLVVQKHPTKLIRDSHTPQVLKLQMGLAAMGAGFLGLGLLRRLRPLAAGGLLAWLALCLSGWPFYRKIIARDPGVLLIAPWLIFIRAWALALGFLLGHFRLRLVRQLKSNRL